MIVFFFPFLLLNRFLFGQITYNEKLELVIMAELWKIRS